MRQGGSLRVGFWYISAVPITVDASDDALLRITFVGAVNDHEFDAYLGAYRAFLERGTRYVVLLDASNATVPTPPQRRLQAEFIRIDKPRLAVQCLGGAFVIQSAVVRGGLTAILWLQPLPFDYVLVKTLAEGEAWCRDRLAARRDGLSP